MRNISRLVTFGIVSIMIVGAAGCASAPYAYGSSGRYSGYGSATSSQDGGQRGWENMARPGVILATQMASYAPAMDNDNHGGAILGAIIGGVIGNQFGHGRGRVLTTTAGAVAGGFAGNTIQHDSNQYQQQARDAVVFQEIEVQLDDGVVAWVRQRPNDKLYTGERVLVFGDGPNMRVRRDN